ncbi:membrane protein insertion efficiency factor YidD [Acidisoma sp.]|uniref:membrane protein insertion efficiency factor YidD n=1 Tax=Acidisoma sp. TaxID=1872115 RepID=UPI003B00CB80
MLATFLRALLIGLVRSYQLVLRPVLGSNCRFTPSCSDYALQAVREYGAVHGGYLAVRRILRCNPWHPGGDDPVPPRDPCDHDHAYENGGTPPGDALHLIWDPVG